MPPKDKQKKRDSQVFSPPPPDQAASGEEGELPSEVDATHQDQAGAASSVLQPELSTACLGMGLSAVWVA